MRCAVFRSLGLTCLLLATAGRAAEPQADLVELPGGLFFQGDPEGEADEAPREVALPSFRIMRHEVTNALFARFVAESGHVTDPERRGWGWVWDGAWRRVDGADWRHPEGPASSIAGLEDHPVVQVSKRDAAAFCTFYGLRLPSDPEWEYAARGTDRRRYPWGDQWPEAEDGSRRANFGTVRCCAADAADGYRTTAAVGSFPQGASPFGLRRRLGQRSLLPARLVPACQSAQDRPRHGGVSLRGGRCGIGGNGLHLSHETEAAGDVGEGWRRRPEGARGEQGKAGQPGHGVLNDDGLGGVRSKDNPTTDHCGIVHWPAYVAWNRDTHERQRITPCQNGHDNYQSPFEKIAHRLTYPMIPSRREGRFNSRGATWGFGPLWPLP
jgi:hypothetical protein